MEYLQYFIFGDTYSIGVSEVLNLVINGIPSIHLSGDIGVATQRINGFKPCYKWNTFNTFGYNECMARCVYSFKPCYKWNTFNTIQ